MQHPASNQHPKAIRPIDSGVSFQFTTQACTNTFRNRFPKSLHDKEKETSYNKIWEQETEIKPGIYETEKRRAQGEIVMVFSS